MGRTLWYHDPYKVSYPKKYAHYLLFVLPIQRRKGLLSGCPPLCQYKQLELVLQTVVNSN